MNSVQTGGSNTKTSQVQTAALQALLQLKDTGQASSSLFEALRGFCTAIESDASYIYKITERGASPQLTCCFGLARKGASWAVLENSITLDQSILGQQIMQQLAKGEPVEEEQKADKQAQCAPLFPGSSEPYLCLFPIMADQQLWGLLGLSFAAPPQTEGLYQSEAMLALTQGLGNFLARLRNTVSKEDAPPVQQDTELAYKDFIQYSNEGIYYAACIPPIPTTLPPEEQAELFFSSAVIQDCNLALAQMYDKDRPEALIGLKVGDSLSETALVQNRNSFHHFAQNGYHTEDAKSREPGRNGQTRWLEHQAIGIVENGRLTGIWGIVRDITKKEMAEEALLESQHRLDMAIEGAHLGIWEWDVSRNTIVYNDFFANLLGYEPGALNCTTEQYLQLVHPEDRLRMNQELRQRTVKTGIFELEYRFRDQRGKYRWLYDRGQVTHRRSDGKMQRASGITIEITRRKETEIALRESEAVNKAVLNALPDLKFRLNAEGYFLDYFATPEENTSLLLPVEEFLGKAVTDVMPDYLAKAILKNLKDAFQNREVQNFEYPLFINQEMRYFEARISAINAEEAMVVVRDITELKRTQQELQKKLQELDRKNQKLEKYVDSNLQLENFAHTVSHDLREPVRTINSFSQLLLQKYSGQLDEDANIYLDFIASSASNMHVLIEDLLEYSRFNAETHVLDIIDLEALLQSVTNALHGLIEDNQAMIEVLNELPSINGSRTKMGQLFQNLISNAIKFRKAEAPPLIQINVEDKGSQWLFSVKDNGIGIDEEYHHQIFLLFLRLHSKKHYPGSGIGLALCKRVVEQHGGRIWVESQPGYGTTFFFTLPKS